MRARDLVVEGRAHPVIVVDVQPAYCDNDLICRDIIEFVNRQTGPVLMFVNAEQDGLTDDTVESIRNFWNDSVCPPGERYIYDKESDEVIENPNVPRIDWNRFTIVDKGYGYFRSWMDRGVSPAVIIKVIRALYQEKKWDSDSLDLEDLLRDEWQPWMSSESLTVQWTSVAQLKRFAGAYIVGGGRNECLREVELLMNAFNIPYRRIDSLVYG